MNAPKMIELWQLKKIHAIARNVGVSRDNLHDMAAAESLKELTAKQAGELLIRLEAMQGKYTPPTKPSKKTSEVAGMATAGQQDKVWALMYQLRDLDTIPSTATVGERLCGIIAKELKINATTENPLKWVTQHNCNKLIEVLKKYISSAQRRGGGQSAKCD